MDQIRDMRKHGWYFVDTTVVIDYGHLLKPVGIAVYNVLAARADNDDQDCFPSQKSIAETIGSSESSVWRAIKQLEELGFIRIDPRFRKDGGRTSNTYTLLKVPEYAPPPSEGRPPSVSENATPSSEGPTNYPQEELSSPELSSEYAEDSLSGIALEEIYYRDREKVSTNGRVYDPPWFADCPACQSEIKIDVLDVATECQCALGAVTLLSKKKQPQIMVPEPLLIYQRLTNRKVPPAWQEEVVSVVGANTDRWQEVVRAYIGAGWNSGNVANMLKYFSDGQIPGDRKQKQNEEATQRTFIDVAPPPDEEDAVPTVIPEWEELRKMKNEVLLGKGAR